MSGSYGTPWPAELRWIIERLQPGTHQEMRSFQPDQGPPITSPKGSPVPTLEGAVTVSEKQWEMLQRMPGTLWVAMHPRNGNDVYLKFLDRPHCRRQTISSGMPSYREIEIKLSVQAK